MGLWIASLALAMTALASCENFKGPSLSDPSRMSADTLCYRQAYAKSNPALADEIAARNLDCEESLRHQRPVDDRGY